MSVFVNRFNCGWKTAKADTAGNPVWAYDWTVRDSLEMSFEELRDWVSGNIFEREVKELTPLWSFMRQVEHPQLDEKGQLKRNRLNQFSGASVIVLDYDGGLSIDTFKERYDGLSCIIYTTHSHGSARKKGKDCFRVLVELDEDIPTPLLLPPDESSGSVLDALQQLFPEGDPTSFEPNRGFYQPSHAPGSKVRVEHMRGVPLDWKALEVVPPLAPRVRPTLPTGGVGGTGKLLLHTLDLERYFTDKGLVKHRTGSKLTVECPNESAHSVKDDATSLFDAGGRMQFKCFHSHCGATSWVRRFLLEAEGEDALRPYCETRQGLTLVTKQVDQRKEQQELEEIRVDEGPQREFTLPWSRERCTTVVKAFVKNALSAGGGVLSTPEGFGKSTQITMSLLKSMRKVVFCTESHAQAEEKTQSFQKFGAVHVWSLGGLLKHRYGIEAELARDAEEWEDNAVDIPATKEKVADVLKLSWEDADILVEELRDEVRDYDHDAPVLITSFHTASRMAESGSLDRVVVVDDASVQTLQSAFYAFENGQWELKHQKPPEKQLFGRVSSRNIVFWTTTEVGVVELLKVKHPGIYVYEVQQELKTGQHVFLYGTRLALSHLRPVLTGMQVVINKECKTAVRLIGNAANSEHNLVNTKGRNDLTGDSTIVISWPPDAAAVGVAGSLGLDVNDRDVIREIKLMLVVDALNQALGRNMGYRHRGDAHSIVLCAPSLVPYLLWRCRYQLHRPDKVEKRTSRLKGLQVPINTLRFESDPPEWLFRWPMHLFLWEKWVKEVVGKDRARILELITTFNQAADPSVDKNHVWNLLQRYADAGAMRWKDTAMLLEGDGRRNYSEHLKELVRMEKKSYTGEHFKKANAARNAARNAAKPRKPNVGRKKYRCQVTGRCKMYAPGTEPPGWLPTRG